MSLKNPVTPPGIDPGTVRLIALITMLPLGPSGKYYNIEILWDHRRICGPSLAETSLRGAYLYSNFCSSVYSMLPTVVNLPSLSFDHQPRVHVKCLVIISVPANCAISSVVTP